MALKIPNLDFIKNHEDFYLIGEALEALKNGVETLGQKTSVNPQGNTGAPAAHNAVNVVAKNGITHVSLVDNNPRTRNAHNFVEYDTDKSFSNAQTIHLGVGRQVRIPTHMGDDTPIYVRSYAMYPDGQRSNLTYHGSPQNPTPIKDGSTTPGPAFPPTTGSGTSTGGGHGFGREAFVSNPLTPGQAPKVFRE